MNSFRRGDEYIHITHLPGYKKPVLAIGNGGVIRKAASFDSEEDAIEFNKMLNRWFGFNLEEKE